MEDYISRQAAIEAINAVFPVDPNKSEYASGIACGAALALTYVKQLPSAQPEIIRCKDCKFADKYNHCSIVGFWSKPDDFCSYAERK